MIEFIMALFTITGLEIVLGVDNLVMLAVLVGQLPPAERKRARHWGLTMAWVTRLLFLATAVSLIQLTHPLFTIFAMPLSVRSLLLILGGLFLLVKATQEIHQMVFPTSKPIQVTGSKRAVFWRVVLQIGLIDIVFSFDSVLTAVGLTDNFLIMSLAITLAIFVMVFAAEQVGTFVEKYPTFKVLVLSFLVLIAMVLIAEGLSFHIPRGYVYFTMAFALMVEGLNIYRQNKHSHRLTHEKNHDTINR